MAVYTADNSVASSVVSIDVPTVDLLTAQIVVSFLIRRLPRAVSKIDVKVGSMERLHRWLSGGPRTWLI